MILQHLIEIQKILEKSDADAKKIVDYLQQIYSVTYDIKVLGKEKTTESLQIFIPAKNKKKINKDEEVICILGRLGGIGARDEMLGMVSDADGALVVLAIAAELLTMKTNGDHLNKSIYLATHICPNAPMIQHNPVGFMGSPVTIQEINQRELCNLPFVEKVVFSVDTTKGNRILNERGFAITPTVKNGYILKVNEDLLDIMEYITGKLSRVLPITTQDITPYDNQIYHINSIMQPATITDAPVIGVAITTQTSVPGYMTGASHIIDLEECGRFLIEVCKFYSREEKSYYDEEEYQKLLELYGSINYFKL